MMLNGFEESKWMETILVKGIERSFFQEPRFSAEVSAFCTDPNFSAVSVSLGRNVKH